MRIIFLISLFILFSNILHSQSKLNEVQDHTNLLVPVIALPEDDNVETEKEWNTFSINTLDLLLTAVTISYEHVYTKAKHDFGFKIKYSRGLLSGSAIPVDWSYISADKIFGVGFELHFFPFGLDNFTWFLGPGYEGGRYKVKFHSLGSGWHIGYSGYKFLSIENGFLLRPSKHINLSAQGGIGWWVDFDDEYLTVSGGLNLGYGF